MNQLELLDVLTIMSFVLQVQNQSKILNISDIENELQAVHAHLEAQDDKIDRILEVLNA